MGEIKRLGIYDLPGGYVLTGGVAQTQGVLELAQVILENRVRIAIPDYIGVREPQYTTAVGLIKFAYKNAKMQGRSLSTQSAVTEPKDKRVPKQTQQPNTIKQEKQSEEKITSRVKKFLGYFFE